MPSSYGNGAWGAGAYSYVPSAPVSPWEPSASCLPASWEASEACPLPPWTSTDPVAPVDWVEADG